MRLHLITELGLFMGRRIKDHSDANRVVPSYPRGIHSKTPGGCWGSIRSRPRLQGRGECGVSSVVGRPASAGQRLCGECGLSGKEVQCRLGGRVMPWWAQGFRKVALTVVGDTGGRKAGLK